jgi:hypothetical protein
MGEGSFPPSKLRKLHLSSSSLRGDGNLPRGPHVRSLITCSCHRTGHDTGPTTSSASPGGGMRRSSFRFGVHPTLSPAESPLLRRILSHRGPRTFPPQLGSDTALRTNLLPPGSFISSLPTAPSILQGRGVRPGACGQTAGLRSSRDAHTQSHTRPPISISPYADWLPPNCPAQDTPRGRGQGSATLLHAQVPPSAPTATLPPTAQLKLCLL